MVGGCRVDDINNQGPRTGTGGAAASNERPAHAGKGGGSATPPDTRATEAGAPATADVGKLDAGTTHSDFEVVHCRDRAPGSACVTSGDPRFGVRIRADLLAGDRVLDAGELVIAPGGSISCVACDCAVDSRALHIDCADAALAPGLINPHDHVSYANNAPFPHDERYEHRHDWRLGLRGHTEIPFASAAPSSVVLAHELRMLMSGVTSTAGAGGRAGLIRNLDTPGLSEGLLPGQIDSDTFPLADSGGTLLASGCAYSSSRTTRAQAFSASAYVPHLAEGIDAEARNEITCSSAGTFDLLSPHTAIVHAIGVGAREAAELGRAGAWVIWSPRSNISLYGNTAPVTLLAQSGVGISLGTDWIVSGSMNLARELRCARSLSDSAYGGRFSDFDLFRMVTIHAALALGVGSGLGQLAPGYTGDVALFAGGGHAGHRAVVDATAPDVQLVLRGGQPLYGDAELVAAFSAAGCEAFDVCGTEKRACVFGDTGYTLSAVRSAGEAHYPLFTCGDPPAEPSCIPQRPGEYAGESHADDRDGDGIPDEIDLCPDVFDPIRPLDSGAQADFDADGLGDACDPCPLVAGACEEPDPNDHDADGVRDAVDNCPLSANAEQLDSDGDGHGDVCDGCARANPGLLPCPVAIHELADRSSELRPKLGTAVEINGVYVTAVRQSALGSQGFFVQDPSGLAYSGLFVFTGDAAAGVSVGARVTLLVYLSDFEGQAELSEPLVRLEAPGGALPFEPIVVAAGDIADQGSLADAYRSMLVRIRGVVVRTVNADDPLDYDEFVVSGGLRIDDGLYPELDNTFAEGTPFAELTGILGQNFGHSKLWPRGASDVRY